MVKKDVISIRSLDRQLYTLNQQKIALTSLCDKCILLSEVDCIRFGYILAIQYFRNATDDSRGLFDSSYAFVLSTKFLMK